MSLPESAAEKNLNSKGSAKPNIIAHLHVANVPRILNFLSDYSSARKTDKLCWSLMTS
jgi:hypothetical protein